MCTLVWVMIVPTELPPSHWILQELLMKFIRNPVGYQEIGLQRSKILFGFRFASYSIYTRSLGISCCGDKSVECSSMTTPHGNQADRLNNAMRILWGISSVKHTDDSITIFQWPYKIHTYLIQIDVFHGLPQKDIRLDRACLRKYRKVRPFRSAW